MAETSSNGYSLAGPGNRTRQGQDEGHPELSFLLQEAARLIERTDLRAASETLREATARAAFLGKDEPSDPEA